MFYILYKTTNLVNYRVYCGIHIAHDPFFGTEMSTDTHIGDTQEIREDLIRYGRNSFIVEAIHAFSDYESAAKALNTILPKLPANSYNAANARGKALKGNQNSLGVVRSEEYKERKREQTTGELNPFYGKQHSAETKQSLSQFRASLMWINNGVAEKQQPKFDPIPAGWQKGRKKARKINSEKSS